MATGYANLNSGIEKLLKATPTGNSSTDKVNEGVNKLLGAFGFGDQYKQAGYNDAANTAALAAARQAMAGKNNAEAQKLLLSMASSGQIGADYSAARGVTPDDMAQQQRFETSGIYTDPVGTQGPMPADRRPATLTDQDVGSIHLGKLLQTFAQAGGGNADQMAGAYSKINNGALQDRAIAGDGAPDQVARILAILKAGSLVDVNGGVAFNRYGDINTINDQPLKDRATIAADAQVRAAGVRGNGRAVTQKQASINSEIDAARNAIAGLSREEITQRTQQATETGRDNPHYDPYLAALVKKATQRKVGDDPEFEQTFKNFYGSSNGPDMSQAKRASDGKLYLPDPDRPGKYLRVEEGE